MTVQDKDVYARAAGHKQPPYGRRTAVSITASTAPPKWLLWHAEGSGSYFLAGRRARPRMTGPAAEDVARAGAHVYEGVHAEHALGGDGAEVFGYRMALDPQGQR
jgi:hypothetical protein